MLKAGGSEACPWRRDAWRRKHPDGVQHGNALGAFLGGLPIAAGLSDRYAALVGAPMALAAAVLMVVFYRKYER